MQTALLDQYVFEWNSTCLQDERGRSGGLIWGHLPLCIWPGSELHTSTSMKKMP